MNGRVLMSRTQAANHIAQIVRAVAELPDRTSPEDQPDMMMVTGTELAAIIALELLAE